MRRFVHFFFGSLLLCVFASVAPAQTPTVVTGTITDANGIPYSFAKVQAQLIPSTATPTIVVKGIPTQIGGQQNATADVNGAFNMNLFCNTAGGGCSVISPSGTQWQFNVSISGVLPPSGTGPQSFSQTFTITGASQTLTFTSVPLLVRGGGGPGLGPGGAANAVQYNFNNAFAGLPLIATLNQPNSCYSTLTCDQLLFTPVAPNGCFIVNGTATGTSLFNRTFVCSGNATSTNTPFFSYYAQQNPLPPAAGYAQFGGYVAVTDVLGANAWLGGMSSTVTDDPLDTTGGQILSAYIGQVGLSKNTNSNPVARAEGLYILSPVYYYTTGHAINETATNLYGVHIADQLNLGSTRTAALQIDSQAFGGYSIKVDGTTHSSIPNLEDPDLTPGNCVQAGSLGKLVTAVNPCGASTLPTLPTAPNGVPQILTSTPSGGVGQAAAWTLSGLVSRAVQGTTATDTFLNTDCSNRVDYRGSVNVAVTLPLASTLAVPNCAFVAVNNSSAALLLITVTPSGGATINGQASLVIHRGQAFRISPDAITATNWTADGYYLPGYAAGVYVVDENTAGADFCAKLVTRLADAGNINATIDAREFPAGSTQTCASNPTASLATPSAMVTIIQGPYAILTSASISINTNDVIWKCQGLQNGSSCVIKANASTFPLSTPLTQIGAAAGPLINSTRFEDIRIDCNGVSGCQPILGYGWNERAGLKRVVAFGSNTAATTPCMTIHGTPAPGAANFLVEDSDFGKCGAQDAILYDGNNTAPGTFRRITVNNTGFTTGLVGLHFTATTGRNSGYADGVHCEGFTSCVKYDAQTFGQANFIDTTGVSTSVLEINTTLAVSGHMLASSSATNIVLNDTQPLTTITQAKENEVVDYSVSVSNSGITIFSILGATDGGPNWYAPNKSTFTMQSGATTTSNMQVNIVKLDGNNNGWYERYDPTQTNNPHVWIPVNAGVLGSQKMTIDNAGNLAAVNHLSTIGTACSIAELVLSAGWGTTAAVSANLGTGQTCEWTITSNGTGQAANPTITDTLTNPLPVATIVCDMRLVGGTGLAALSGAGLFIDQTTLSATAPVFTFGGTPVAASTYKVVRRCGP